MMSRMRSRLRRFVPLLVLLAAACAEVQVQKPIVKPVFPPPPEPPRYYWEHVLVSTVQVLRGDSKSRLRTMVTGETEIGIGFAKPFDVSVCQGRVYVADSVARFVFGLDFPGGRFFQVGVEEPGELAKPLGIATDGQCNVYVVDATRQRINIYDRDGKYLRSLGGTEMFSRLSHVAVDPAGTTIFAVDTGEVLKTEGHRVRVIDARSGTHLRDIGARGDRDGQLNLPRDVELGPDGLVYVVDGANFRVQVFTQDGTFVRKFGEIGRRIGQFSRPKGIAIDAQGRIYVTDTSHGNFQVFTPEGQLLLFVGTRGDKNDPAKYLLPAGIDVDEDGRVYMVDQFFAKVDVYRPAELPTDQGHLGIWSRSLVQK